MLLETMIRPALRLFMAGRNAWMVRTAPKRFTSKRVFMAWSEQVSSGPISPTPALQTARHGAVSWAQGSQPVTALHTTECQKAEMGGLSLLMGPWHPQIHLLHLCPAKHVLSQP